MRSIVSLLIIPSILLLTAQAPAADLEVDESETGSLGEHREVQEDEGSGQNQREGNTRLAARAARTPRLSSRGGSGGQMPQRPTPVAPVSQDRAPIHKAPRRCH
jgi:hypothetical protein